MLDSIRKNGLTLACFAIITTGITAIVNLVTKPTVAYQMALQQKALLDQVLPPTLYNNQLQQACYLLRNPQLGDDDWHRLYLARMDDEPVAAAIETTAPDGYSGAIKMLVAADFKGQVLGVRVIEHHETPGLGDKIELRISNWILQFSGKRVSRANDGQFAVKKDGGEFDQFTGATITPRAVVNQTKRTTLLLSQLPERLASLVPCGEKHE
jgi:Na+-translocating ferredoxin:NAD+ oxidoreductase subunit G